MTTPTTTQKRPVCPFLHDIGGMFSEPVGATVTVLFHGETEPIEGYYIHFGDCPQNDDEDDSHVFYYASGEHEIKKMMVHGALDFVVKSYILEY